MVKVICDICGSDITGKQGFSITGRDTKSGKILLNMELCEKHGSVLIKNMDRVVKKMLEKESITLHVGE